MGPYQMLPLCASMDQETMAMKGYTTFLKIPNALVSYQKHWLGGGGVLLSVEMQSAYSAAPADCTIVTF